MMMLRHFTTNDAITLIESAIEEDGACIVDSLISETLCDQLMADFLPHIGGVNWCNVEAPDAKFEGLKDKEFFGIKTKRFHGLPGLSSHCPEIISHPYLLKLAYHMLGAGKSCRDIRVSTMELMVLGQGEVQQSFHRDFDSWPYTEGSRHHLSLISANIALCDFTENNGATIVVPGSHRWPKDREPKPFETCRAIMNKGSALIYSGDVLHGGGSNHEPEIRTGFYVGYIPSWLSNLENHAVSNPPETIEALDDKTRSLLDIVPGGWIVVP